MSEPTPARPRMIIDCDPGVDDAMAIIAAARWADLVGITTVAGNVPLEHTTANACRLRSLLGLDVERSEEHTSELQSRPHLVCRLPLEKTKKKK